MGLYLGGLIIGRIFTSEIWGAYFQEGLFLFFYSFFSLGGGGIYYRNFTQLPNINSLMTFYANPFNFALASSVYNWHKTSACQYCNKKLIHFWHVDVSNLMMFPNKLIRPHKAIAIKCFISHCPITCKSGSVSRLGKK